MLYAVCMKIYTECGKMYAEGVKMYTIPMMINYIFIYSEYDIKEKKLTLHINYSLQSGERVREERERERERRERATCHCAFCDLVCTCLFWCCGCKTVVL